MATKSYADMRSNWEFGEASECRKGLMCGMGYTVEEQRRPLIGVVNSWNEYNPGHVHLDKLAERVKQGIREAGGLPVEVMTTAVCDGMVMKDPRYIEVPSRNLIADQVELTSESNMFDGMVLLSTCDSIVPGHLMGAARVNIPTILVTGGYMPLGHCRGKEVLHIHAQDKVGAAHKGAIDMDLYNDLIENSWGTCGACTSMTTPTPCAWSPRRWVCPCPTTQPWTPPVLSSTSWLMRPASRSCIWWSMTSRQEM